MIQKLTIGKYYNIVGIGPWASYSQDVKVISQTKAQTAEEQEITIFEDWYEGYGVGENFYQKFLEDNGPVYACKVVESRDPSIMNEGDSLVYIFPDMVDYSASSELISARTYKWEIHTKPYKEKDPFNPIAILPANIIGIMNDALKPYLFDSITMYKDETEIIISEAEWEKLNSIREGIKAEVEHSAKSVINEDSRQRSIMYQKVSLVESEREKLRLKNEESAKFLRQAAIKFDQNNAFDRLLALREQELRRIYTIMVQKGSDLNQHLPPEEVIILPPFDEL